MQPVSVIILTKNEEVFVVRAIASAKPFADEIVVLDTHSTDRTCEIAEAAGATCYRQDWLGWVGQRRKGAAMARNDWVFFLESDEIITPDLASDVYRVMADDPNAATGFVVERKEEFLGHLMLNTRRASKRRTFVRLYNKTKSDWKPDMLIHEELQCSGPLITLQGALLHWRNYNIADQISTYNRNSDLEAREIIHSDKGGLVLRLIFKPPLRFLWVYVKCGHWRLGSRGFIWAWMNAIAEFLRVAKAWESRYAPPVTDPPASIYRRPSPDESEPVGHRLVGARPDAD